MTNKNEFRTKVYLRQELIKETFKSCALEILRGKDSGPCKKVNSSGKDLFSKYFNNVFIFHAEDVDINNLHSLDYSKAIFTNKSGK